MSSSPGELAATGRPFELPHPDAELISAVLASDRPALEQFVQRFRPSVLRYLWQATGRHDDAEDLASQAILRAIRDLGQFRHGGPLAAWVFRVAHRELLRYRRRQKLQRPQPEPEPVHPASGVDALVIADALTKVPLPQRSAFLLTEVEGFSVDEAASILRIPAGTVKSRSFHAKQRLRALLSSTYQEVR